MLVVDTCEFNRTAFDTDDLAHRYDFPRDIAPWLFAVMLMIPAEAEVSISTSSPIGRAILNKEECDEVAVSTPAGARTARSR